MKKQHNMTPWKLLEYFILLDKQGLLLVNHLSFPPLLQKIIIASNFLGLPYLWIFVPFIFTGLPVKDKKWLIIFYFLSFTSIILLNVNIKYLILRKRPDFTILRVVPARSPSFPSGHTSTAWAGATSANAFFKENKESKKIKALKISLYAVALLVAFDRMYVGVHYPMDVLAGILESYVLARIFLLYFVSLARDENEARKLHSHEKKIMTIIVLSISRLRNETKKTLHFVQQKIHGNKKIQNQRHIHQKRQGTVKNQWEKHVNSLRIKEPLLIFLVLYSILLIIIVILFGIGFMVLHAKVTVYQFLLFIFSSGEVEPEDVIELSQKLFIGSLLLIVFGSLFSIIFAKIMYNEENT